VRSGFQFSFCRSLKRVENLEFDVVSRLYRGFEMCYQYLFIESKKVGVTNFLFCLIKKETKKSLPENKKLKNYLKVPFHSPSRSSFVLNSRTVATLLFRCFFMLFI
jgi:hypothetical protein